MFYRPSCFLPFLELRDVFFNREKDLELAYKAQRGVLRSFLFLAGLSSKMTISKPNMQLTRRAHPPQTVYREQKRRDQWQGVSTIRFSNGWTVYTGYSHH